MMMHRLIHNEIIIQCDNSCIAAINQPVVTMNKILRSYKLRSQEFTLRC